MRMRHLGLVLPLIMLAGCAPGRTFEAMRLLLDVAREGSGEVCPVASSPGRAPLFTNGQGGDLYWPEGGARAALVLVPGVTPAGRDDPRLVDFAGVLVRRGFAIFVPEIPEMRKSRVSPEDAQAIVRALDGLAGCYPDEENPRLGLAAISYAVGPAVIAAMDDAVREEVAVLLGVGGYHDIVAVIRYFTTGYHRDAPDEPWRQGRPAREAKWIFLEANADRLASARDASLLARIAERRLDDPDAAIDDLEARLGRDGRRVMALVTNRDPDRVEDLVAALPASLREVIAGLDLARRDLSRLEARLILVHGRDDPVIPASQSRALARAVPEERVRLHIVESLGHVELGAGGLFDPFRLLGAASALLEARDGLPPPSLDVCDLADDL